MIISTKQDFFGQRYFLFDFIQRFACSCNYSYLSKSPLKYLDTSHHRKICSFLPSTRYLSFLGFSVLHSLGQFAKSEKFFSRDFFRFDALYFRNRMKGQNLWFNTLQVHRQPFTIFLRRCIQKLCVYVVCFCRKTKFLFWRRN